jgi:general secretion pathway protein F
MPNFRYTAEQTDGQTVQGFVHAETAKQARQSLRNQGLQPLSIASEDNKTTTHTHWFTPELKNHEVVLLTRQLASLLEAQLPVAQALSALIEQAQTPLLQKRLTHIRNDISAGGTLAQAFGRFPKAFPDIYQATIAAGESSGNLGQVMARLADTLEVRQALKQKITAAFIYPTIVSFVALCVVLGLLTYVVPKIVVVFESTHQNLPFLTHIMMALANYLKNYGMLSLLVLLTLTLLARQALKKPFFALKFDTALLHLPIVGSLVRAINTARLASTLAILISSGVPILKALQAANRTLSNRALAQAMQNAQLRVREGAPLAKALQQQALFPPVLIHLIASGETTGELNQMLIKAEQIQRQEVERKTLWFTSLLEPILILVMGVLVLLIVLAVMLPIIEVNQLIA